MKISRKLWKQQDRVKNKLEKLGYKKRNKLTYIYTSQFFISTIKFKQCCDTIITPQNEKLNNKYVIYYSNLILKHKIIKYNFSSLLENNDNLIKKFDTLSFVELLNDYNKINNKENEFKEWVDKYE